MVHDVDRCGKCCDNFIVNSKNIKCNICSVKFHLCVSLKDSWCNILSENANIIWSYDQCCDNLKANSNGRFASIANNVKHDRMVNGERNRVHKMGIIPETPR